ncbi:MAG: dihydrofolate reductase [Verrucomicrobia bacterium]|nr:dihydrofolate reductase [Verrucomicrobiota bacterium]MCH8513220.1 dihydrofolate reductase [Kiritimatiellia bacterium]
MKRPRIAMIAAMDRHHVIGKEGQLPWHLPGDLKRFKELTSGHTILMGRKTWDSIGRPLPNRRNLVFSRRTDFAPEGAECVRSVDEALAKCAGERMLFVIGGAEIYQMFLPWADELFLTEVHTDVEGGDTFFPQIPPGMFQEICRVSHHADERHDFAHDFVEYEKIR